MSFREKMKKIEIITVSYDCVRQGWLKLQIMASPSRFIERKFKKRFKREIDWDNLQTFNEKLNWMKLYWQDPILTKCIDKYTVRDYVEKCGLGESLVKLYGVYDSIDDVNFDELPEKFALKMNNGSGCNILCRDKSELDVKAIKKQFRREFKRNYYYTYCEWATKISCLR